MDEKLYSSPKQTYSIDFSSSIQLSKAIESSNKACNIQNSFWTEAEDSMLMQVFSRLGVKNWELISNELDNKRSPAECMLRWKLIHQSFILKGTWNKEEDEKLIFWVNLRGESNWAECSKYIQGRSRKQCRDRWINCLDPMIKKGEWNSQEDYIILKSLIKQGYNWSRIAQFLKGRTANSVKNRFYCLLRKILSEHENQSSEHPQLINNNIQLSIPDIISRYFEKTYQIMDHHTRIPVTTSNESVPETRKMMFLNDNSILKLNEFLDLFLGEEKMHLQKKRRIEQNNCITNCIDSSNIHSLSNMARERIKYNSLSERAQIKEVLATKEELTSNDIKKSQKRKVSFIGSTLMMFTGKIDNSLGGVSNKNSQQTMLPEMSFQNMSDLLPAIISSDTQSHDDFDIVNFGIDTNPFLIDNGSQNVNKYLNS